MKSPWIEITPNWWLNLDHIDEIVIESEDEDKSFVMPTEKYDPLICRGPVAHAASGDTQSGVPTWRIAVSDEQQIDRLICAEISDVGDFLEKAKLQLKFNKRSVSFYDSKGNFVLSISKNAQAHLVGACIAVLTKKENDHE